MPRRPTDFSAFDHAVVYRIIDGHRPPGEVRHALLDAIGTLAAAHQPGHGPILLEIAQAANVGRVAAMATLDNLVRAGKVVPVARRWVAHSRKPVAEYALPAPLPVQAATSTWAQLEAALREAVKR